MATQYAQIDGHWQEGVPEPLTGAEEQHARKFINRKLREWKIDDDDPNVNDYIMMAWEKFITRIVKNPLSSSHPEMLPDAGKVVSLGNPGAAWHKARGEWYHNAIAKMTEPLDKAYFEGLRDESVLSGESAEKFGIKNPGTVWHSDRAAKHRVAAISHAKLGLRADANVFKELEAENRGAAWVSEAKGIPNPRPPKGWWIKMYRGVAARYNRVGKKRLSQITAGIWWQLPESTRRKLIRQYDNPEEVWHKDKRNEYRRALKKVTGEEGRRFWGGAAMAEEVALQTYTHNPEVARKHAEKGIGLFGIAALAGLTYLIWKNRSQ